MDGPLAARGRRAPTARQWLAGALQILFHLAYPLVVYLAYTRLETRALGTLLLALYVCSLAFRVRASWSEIRPLIRQHLPLAGLIALAIATNHRDLLLLIPMGVSAYLLWTFASSLRAGGGPPMVERFARIVEDDLPDFTLPYCRKVTWLWCGFLAANSLCVVVLAIAAPVSWWALYTGLLFYLLLGTLLGVELVFRKLWFRYYGDGPGDWVFERLFPAEQTANGRRSLAYVEARERASAAVSPPSV
jgi:uncharacterized membrane protein